MTDTTPPYGPPRGAAAHLDMPGAALDARFRALADALPQLVWTADASGRVTYYNARSAAYEGIRQTADGRWVWEPVVHPDDLDLTIGAWSDAVAAGRTYQCEHRIRMTDGQFRWHLSRGVPVHDGGRVVQWFGTATDIHTIKAAEEELQAASRNKDEFLALLAHELRNPLAPIRNALELMRERPLDEGTRRLHAMLDRQVSHMVRLVEDLLEISRISRGELRLLWSRVDLRETVRAAIESVDAARGALGHRLTVSLPDGVVPVEGDGVRLTQAVGNLLNNAVKFTPANGTIEVALTVAHGWARLVVHDSGIGIAPAMLERVFEMFTQVSGDGHLTSGLGIGLALVRRIVELHGGRVEAHSHGAGTGSTFEVHLPVLAT